MGMNHSGEIQPLAAMVRPHVALVTWVAGAHLAYLGSEEAIAAAKAEIFEGVVPGGTAIWPADNPHAPLLRAKAEAFGLRPLSFGEGAGADVRLLSAVPGVDGTDIVADVAGEELHFRVGMAGRHWVSNALAVVAAVHAAGGDIAEAGLALAELTGLPGRGARLVVPVSGGTATILDESYNANPASMAAALAVLGAMPGRRLALLGDMRELGEQSAALHAGIAAPLAAAGVAEVALVGPEIAVLEHDGATRLADAAAALAWARATLKPGDVLLVKGSNGVGLGRVVAGLQQEQAA
jgi:UDP-N-acetylmuramoyl-tripeptide--D-alanyl-D-alanine ligase